jgi:hypothetical protein
MNHLKNAEQKASELVSAAKNSKPQFGVVFSVQQQEWLMNSLFCGL